MQKLNMKFEIGPFGYLGVALNLLCGTKSI